MTHSLEWPSLTVEWLPNKKEFLNIYDFSHSRHKEEGYSIQQLCLATHTADDYPNSIMKATIRLPLKEKETQKSALDNAQNSGN